MRYTEATPTGGVIIDVATLVAPTVTVARASYPNIADNDPAEFERACIDRPKDSLPDQWTDRFFAHPFWHALTLVMVTICAITRCSRICT